MHDHAKTAALRVAARFIAGASDTPNFDAAWKLNAETKLGAICDRAARLADKAKARKGTPDDLVKLAETQADLCYKALDLLRPILSHGRRELEPFARHDWDSVKQARLLVDALHQVDDTRNQILGGRREMPSYDLIPLVNNAFLHLSTLEQTYKQFRATYEH